MADEQHNARPIDSIVLLDSWQILLDMLRGEPKKQSDFGHAELELIDRTHFRSRIKIWR
ncbi:hypothetical protein DFJ68_2207 [Terracoccus luteus]|uniref:Uncharacterized protein n=1 Tax=Terracoccus luteus TaxID=53356 RepID=A0A495Y3F9_9MICO|nr:hypothetical protein DFJ68_2207 [Terracoccus luteus]